MKEYRSIKEIEERYFPNLSKDKNTGVLIYFCRDGTPIVINGFPKKEK